MKSFSDLTKQLTETKHYVMAYNRAAGRSAPVKKDGEIEYHPTKEAAHKKAEHLNSKTSSAHISYTYGGNMDEAVMQPNGTDKVGSDKGMDGNAQSPDKKTKKSKVSSDVTILNGEQEPAIKEEALDELSKKTLGSYAHKATDSAQDHAHDAYDSYKDMQTTKMGQHQHSVHKRLSGLERAGKKLGNKSIAKHVEKAVDNHIKAREADNDWNDRKAASHSDRAYGHSEKAHDKIEKKSGVKEAVYVEESRTESGELFKSLVDRAHDASERGDHTQAKRHLANAQTARYGITSGNIAKHKKSFDRYKELKHSYTNSDEHVREETINEAGKPVQPHELKQIHKEYQYHKSRSTADVLKTHKGIHRVQSQNYTASEMGGKEGLISDIMHNKHGKQRMDAYHSLSSKHKKALSETEAVMPSYTKENISIDEATVESKDGVHRVVHRGHTVANYYNKSEAIKHADALTKEQDTLEKRLNKEETVDEHIVKVGSEYELKSKTTGKNLGKYPTKAGAEKREKQVQYFKHANEEVEQIDEISKDTLRSYANKAFAHGNDLHYDIAHSKDKDEKAKMKAKLSKRNDGVIKASQKLNREATDTVKKDASGKVIAWSHEGDWEKLSTKKQGSGKAANLAGKALQQTKKLAKEEIEEDINESAWGRDKMSSLRQAHDRHMEKALAANKAGDDEAVKTHQRKMQMIQGKMQKLKQNEEVSLGEECEILFEISSKTLDSYRQKAFADNDPKNQEKRSKGRRLAFDKMVHKNAVKVPATEELTVEEVEEFMQTEAYEQLDELSKKTLGNYIKKAANEKSIYTAMAVTSDNGSDYRKEYSKKSGKRSTGITKAVDKLTKEDTMLTYSEFMAQLAEGKADDLKDKLAADREARLNNYDYSKEKVAKKAAVQKVKGHSYGAGEEEGEDDEGTTKTAKPASEKRGRGRPTGSKSGARV